jgi:Fe-S-cluster containining protein
MGSPTRKEELWLACRDKTCCYTRFVVPSGRDIWRIARALDLPPWTFLVYFEAREPRPDAFALDASERRFCLLLSKRPSRRKRTPPPCIFLVRTRRGYHRCGLGPLRPRVCQAYPAELAEDVVCLRLDGGCTCRRWALADVDITQERSLVQARRAELREYHAIVAEWNRHVAELPPGAGAEFTEFCQFLLETYAARAEPHDQGPEGV